jgi:hypothetical protein
MTNKELKEWLAASRRRAQESLRRRKTASKN